MPTAASRTPPPATGGMPRRVFNFSAGPAVLPEEVILQAQEDLWSIDGSGIGIMEHSHRGKVFDRVIDEAEADARSIADITDDYAVLFLQGGATLQFSMLAMNFLPAGQTADYLHTGVWTQKAINEASKVGNVHVAYDGSADGFDHTPEASEIKMSPSPAYVHYCSNNTIYGTRYPVAPAGSHPLVADMSSEMFSRPFDLAPHGLIYAGAQKNLGPSGVTLVIVRRDWLDRCPENLPVMLDYRQQAAKGSRLNTPPTFGIYIMGQVFKWIQKQGGLDKLSVKNDAKAKIIYDAIDGSGGFYRPVAREACRSTMNVTFRTPSADLDGAFVTEAAKQEMSGLKGHRDLGGLRASIYNAFPEKGCHALASFMKTFADRNG